MNIGIIIVAAGNGTRMGSRLRKPYLEIAGVPILIQTLMRFLDISETYSKEIILVVHKEEISRTQELLERYNINGLRIVAGGAERQDSVQLGLSALSERTEYVLIHDGARPFVSKRLILNLLERVKEKLAVIPAIPVKDTVKVVTSDEVAYTPDRKSLWAAQTPQAFRLSTLKEAYELAKRDNFSGTDDASLLEKMGHPVYIVNGEYTNIKITTQEDLLFGEIILKMMEEQNENRSRL